MTVHLGELVVHDSPSGRVDVLLLQSAQFAQTAHKLGQFNSPCLLAGNIIFSCLFTIGSRERNLILPTTLLT